MQVAPPLALTMGEPAGICAEITAAAWRELKNTPKLAFFWLSDASWAATTGMPIIPIHHPKEAVAAFPSGLPVLDLPLASAPRPGEITAGNAPAVVKSIETAVRLIKERQASGIVTNPIHKKALYDAADFQYPGHTEFLAALGDADQTVMMLACKSLRVVPTTIHIPLTKISESLSAALLTTTIRITRDALVRDFGIDNPRIVIAGLNPHAGENGAIGKEEITTIAPVVRALKNEGLNIAGPSAADTLFHAEARSKYDVAVCMYHDQALVPIKTLAFDKAVNVTLGLPFVRTSPDHGPALDIAGTGRASPTSLIEAIRLAADMAERRRQ